MNRSVQKVKNFSPARSKRLISWSSMTTAHTTGRPREFALDDVLDAFVELFSEQGYEATSMADIVAATGLSKSSLYNAFGSKRDLLDLALKRYFEEMFPGVEAILANGTEGLADLHRFTELKAEMMREPVGRHGCLSINTTTEMAYRDGPLADQATIYRQRLRELMRQALERAAELGEVDSTRIDSHTDLLLATTLSTWLMVRSGAGAAELTAMLSATDDLIESFRIR